MVFYYKLMRRRKDEEKEHISYKRKCRWL